jgi:hypothetical protein
MRFYLARLGQAEAPAIVQAAGGNACFAYDEFFSGIDSPHTERAYRNAVHRFLAWCEERGLALNQVRPSDVGDYIKKLAKETGEPSSSPTKPSTTRTKIGTITTTDLRCVSGPPPPPRPHPA